MYFKSILKVALFSWLIFISLPLSANDWLYTVRPNEQASTIANKYLINPYRIDEVLKYNGIKGADSLLPGTVLKIPLSRLKFGPARVQVIAVQGEVSIVRNNQETLLTTIHSIQLGDRVVTGKNSSATMRFADRSELFLGSEAELVFDVLTQWGRTGMVDSRMRLLKGSVEGRVEKLQGPGAHFEVHTPSAVATVRGTEFRVRVNDDNTEVTYNEVSEGKVRVDNNVSELMVPQGFGTVSEKGKDSGDPIELLEAPVLTYAEDNYPAKPVNLQWQSNSEATGYRVELFKDKAFNNQVKSIKVLTNKISLDDIEPGTFAVRIRAIDTNGLEGLDRRHYFELKGAPEAPKSLLGRKKLLSGESLNLKWQPSSNAEKYVLELSKTSSFDSPISTQEIESNNVEIKEPIAPGTYYWRVLGVNDYGKGYPSDARIFEVELPKVPKITSLQDVEFGKAVPLAASKVPLATAYQWQISKNKNFTDVIETKETISPELALSGLESGEYYVRVAAKGPYNTQRYSNPKEFKVYEINNHKNEFMFSSLLLILLAL